ncbi:MAG: phosphoglycolate phosphatase [Marinosulfonomonas sp.]|nr:phosphoglycolate phosphatase [Marinosulfonomonas sp.]
MSSIVFDLDGTLIDSAPDLHAAANRLLQAEGHSGLSLAQVKSFIGNGVPVLVAKLAKATGLDQSAVSLSALTARFVTDYDAHSSDLTMLYPGVLDALSVLRDRGVRLGICTNKPAVPTQTILSAFQLDGFFEVVIGGDTFPVRKPDPKPLLAAFEQLGDGPRLYVGDSEVDANTALAAAVPFALFTQGYRKTPVEDFECVFHFEGFETLVDQARTAEITC